MDRPKEKTLEEAYMRVFNYDPTDEEEIKMPTIKYCHSHKKEVKHG